MESRERNTVSEKIKHDIRLPPDPVVYDAIRTSWKKHSIAEDRHHIEELVTTLTHDCVYEIVGTEHKWIGRDGATRFYKELITAFPDIKFDLQHIVIGPQGVFEEALVTLTHKGPYLGFAPTEHRKKFRIGIYVPWNPTSGLFSGERIFADFKTVLSDPNKNGIIV